MWSGTGSTARVGINTTTPAVTLQSALIGVGASESLSVFIERKREQITCSCGCGWSLKSINARLQPKPSRQLEYAPGRSSQFAFFALG